MKVSSFVSALLIISSEISLAASGDGAAAARAASGPSAPAAGKCSGLTVGGQNLDSATPKRLKKLERWCGKGGKGGGSLHQELAKLKKQFTENSCDDLTEGGPGMTGAKASNLNVKGMIAKAEERLQETCAAYQKYAAGAADLCRQYGAAGAEVKAGAAGSAGGSNQRSLCDAAKTSGISATKLGVLERRAAGLEKEARKVKGLRGYDDTEMKKNLEDLEVFTKMTMTALNRQAKMSLAARQKEAATSSKGPAIRFARASDVNAFQKRMGTCQEAVKSVKPFLKNYRSLASDLNYFQVESSEMQSNFRSQRKAHQTRTTELARRSDGLNSGEQGQACAASLASAKGTPTSGQAGKSGNPAPSSEAAASEKVAADQPKPRAKDLTSPSPPTGDSASAAAKPAATPRAPAARTASAEKNAGAGAGAAPVSRAPASVSHAPSFPSDLSAETFPPSDQAAFRTGRENLRLSPMQTGETYNSYAQRVAGARPVGGVITISNGTRWQTYTGGKLQDRRMLLPAPTP